MRLVKVITNALQRMELLLLQRLYRYKTRFGAACGLGNGDGNAVIVLVFNDKGLDQMGVGSI
jgi:hypothetical protein